MTNSGKHKRFMFMFHHFNRFAYYNKPNQYEWQHFFICCSKCRSSFGPTVEFNTNSCAVWSEPSIDGFHTWYLFHTPQIYFSSANNYSKTWGEIESICDDFSKTIKSYSNVCVRALFQTNISDILSRHLFLVHTRFFDRANTCRLIVCGPCQWRINQTNLDSTVCFCRFMENRIETTIQWGCQQFHFAVWLAVLFPDTETNSKYGRNNHHVWISLAAITTKQQFNYPKMRKNSNQFFPHVETNRKFKKKCVHLFHTKVVRLR